MSNHTCPSCSSPMTAQVQEALVKGRPDTVMLRCSRYTCDYTCDLRDLRALTDAELDGFRRTHAAPSETMRLALAGAQV